MRVIKVPKDVAGVIRNLVKQVEIEKGKAKSWQLIAESLMGVKHKS